ncbi:MAG: hypothetical protein WCL42_02085 [Chlorobiaceae bacterium]|jgi:hypothetical protein
MSLDQIKQWTQRYNKVLSQRVKTVLILLTGITLAVLVYFSVNLAFLYSSTNNSINTKAINAARSGSRKIDNMAKGIERTVRDITLVAEKKEVNENDLIDILSDKSNNALCRYSIRFLSDSESSAVYKRLSSLGSINRLMDMTVTGKSDSSGGLPYAELAGMKDGWQKAAWNKSDKSVVLNYQKRLYTTSGSGEKKLIGVVSARTSIDDFQKLLDFQTLGQYGYRFLVNGDGVLLDHPDKNLVINNFKLLDYARSTYSAENSKNLLHAFKTKAGVSISEKSIINGQKTVFRFEPVASTGWFIGIALIVDELTVPNSFLKQQLMQLLSVFIFFLLLAGLYFILLSSSSEIFHKRIKQYSWFVSCMFIAGLVGILSLYITKGANSPYEDNCITASSQIEQYKKEQTDKAQNTQSSPPQFIQTGITVNSLSVSEPNEMAEVYGTMWQRIPAGMDAKQVGGILFPDQIETKMYESFRMEENGFQVIGWNFCTRLQQDLKSSLYPFDRYNIKIRMCQPKKFGSTIFVPDIASYKITSPSTNPMVSDGFSISGWNVNSTYFNFSEHADNIDFGRRTLMESPIVKDLTLNIAIERDWLSSVISMMIPIFIIMVILFSGVYMITHEKESESFSFDANEATAIGTAFTMFLVVTIQSVRIQVIPQGILYIEKIYFIIYLAMLINVIFVVAITKQTGFLFTYKHGIFYRYLYWPLYTGIFYIITLVSFY